MYTYIYIYLAYIYYIFCLPNIVLYIRIIVHCVYNIEFVSASFCCSIRNYNKTFSFIKYLIGEQTYP